MTRVRHQIPVPESYGDEWYERIRCAFGDCENPASSLHTRVICNASAKHRMSSFSDMCYFCERRAYCCAEHLDYDRHSHIPGAYGRRNLYSFG